MLRFTRRVAVVGAQTFILLFLAATIGIPGDRSPAAKTVSFSLLDSAAGYCNRCEPFLKP